MGLGVLLLCHALILAPSPSVNELENPCAAEVWLERSLSAGEKLVIVCR